MCVFVLSTICAAKTGFHREHVRDLELSPKRHSRSRLLGLVDGEAGLVKAEVVAKFAHDEGKYSGFVRLLFKIVSVHEDVLAA